MKYIRQIDEYYIYMKNPPFNSLVWGSLRLAPNLIIHQVCSLFGI